MTVNPDDLLEQTQWDYFWVPEDVQVVDRPELLYFRCPRDAVILNTVTRTRGDAYDLPDLIREVSQAHRQVRSRWLVREIPETAALKAALSEAGYRPFVETHATAIAVETYAARPSSQIVVEQVHDMKTLQDCVQVIDRSFCDSRLVTEAEAVADLKNCTGDEARVQRFVAYDRGSGEPISSGGLSLHPDLRFGFLWAGCTVEGQRRRGAYGAVLAARIHKARELGYSHVGLYAMIHTSAPIVARHGFERVGTMTYWQRPAPILQGATMSRPCHI